QLETRGESYGVHAWLVPIRDPQGQLLPGVRAEDCGRKMGLNGVDNGRLWFDDVRVPRTSLLDRFGKVAVDGSYSSPIPAAGKRFFTMLGTLVGGRINAAGASLSASKLGLSIALRYATRRHQFPDDSGVEKTLIEYLTHQQRLLPALASAYAFSFAQQAMLQRLEAAQKKPELGREIGTLAAGLKAIGTWQAIDTLQKCRECCGGQGYLSANRIDSLRVDADVFTTFEGDNTVLSQLVAKDLLRNAQRRRKGSPLAALGSVVSDVADAVARNPIAQRMTSDDALLDFEFQLEALRFRERTLTHSLARRIEKRIADGASASEAFDACQDHAVSLARAYVTRFVLESFQPVAKDDPVLKQLCSLFGLTCLEVDFGWFLENDYLAASKVRVLRKQRNALLAELQPLALALVEAFAIPSTCLGPLADPAYLVDSGLAPSP
ncbi:MAG TPA: acyl-CoA dehydrogenase, partial [Polyangiales bacterium]|nr:acyl-CoA dehydrogenase [Polyangiales bacterium]